MKMTFQKFFLSTSALGIIILSSFYSPIVFAAPKAAPKCSLEKQEFKKIYLELQALYLNYEGKDTVVDAKGNFKLVAHDPKKEYEGKIFETAIYKEYQNTLKKVGKLYQAAKFNNNSEDLKSSPGLVEFLKAIDGQESSAYIQKNRISDVIDDLYKASQSKFSKENSKYALNENDKYLLKKLLTHAQDRVCSVETFERTGKRTPLFDANYLGQVRNAPLNRLIGVIKNANINADSDLLLVDEKAAITSAMAEHMNQLNAWMKKNTACKKEITNPNFLQANVQSCNYNKFLDVLGDDNVTQIESFLHFINANERLLNRPQALAETALDDLRLESFIDKTFSDMGTMVSCTRIAGPNGSERHFVRNLPYENNKFDTSKITCKLKGKDLKPNECAQKIELVSDDLGRGVELRQKEKTGAPVTFSILENAKGCADMGGGNSKGENKAAPKLDLNKESEKNKSNDKNSSDKNPKDKNQNSKDDSLDPAKSGKSDNAPFDSDLFKNKPKSDDICQKEAAQSGGKNIYATEDKQSCTDHKGPLKCEKDFLPSLGGTYCTPKMTAEKCEAIGKKSNPPEKLIPSEDLRECIPDIFFSSTTGTGAPTKTSSKPIELNCDKDMLPSLAGAYCVEKMTPEKCKIIGSKKSPPEDLGPSADFRECEPLFFGNTKEKCKALGEKSTPKKDLLLGKNGQCKERETINSCDRMSDPQEQYVPSEDGLTCVVKQTTESCQKLNGPQDDFIPSKDGRTCVERQTLKSCKERGEKLSNPPRDLVPSPDETDCVDKDKQETGKNEAGKDTNKGLKTDAICKKEGDAKDPKEILVPSEDKKSCIKPSDYAARIKKCKEDNDAWKKLQGDIPGTKFKWDEKKKDCIDLKPKDKDDEDDDDYEDDGKGMAPNRFKLSPQMRFQPINIPTRTPYLSPGAA